MFFKSRIKVWLTLIVASLVISVLPSFVKNFLNERKAKREAAEIYTEWTINLKYGDATLKNKLSEKLLDINGKNVKLIVRTEDPDIIISDKEEEIEGYTELKDYLYVPYIMVANPNITSNQDCFNRTSDKKEKYTKDIRYILSAMENDQKWKAIGMDQENVSKGYVRLMIPDEYSSAYPKIREYFVYALNNYETPSVAERADLERRADEILEKCVKAENLASEFDKNSWFKEILLCPESIISERPKSFNNACSVIAPTKTIRDTYNVYIKTEKVDEAKEILKAYTFLEVSGYRNRDYNDISNSSSYSYSFDTFDFIEIGNVDNYKLPDAAEIGKRYTEDSEENETEAETEIEETETEAETEEETNETEEIKETENETQPDQDMEEVDENEESTEESAESTEESDGFAAFLLVVFIIILVIAVVSLIIYASI